MIWKSCWELNKFTCRKQCAFIIIPRRLLQSIAPVIIQAPADTSFRFLLILMYGFLLETDYEPTDQRFHRTLRTTGRSATVAGELLFRFFTDCCEWMTGLCGQDLTQPQRFWMWQSLHGRRPPARCQRGWGAWGGNGRAGTCYTLNMGAPKVNLAFNLT